MSRISTTVTIESQRIPTTPRPRVVPALVLVWSAMEPWRVGEVALLNPADGPLVLGRGNPQAGSESPVTFARQRPSTLVAQGPLAGPGISRRQLLLRPGPGKTLHVDRLGRCPVTVGARHVDEVELAPGDLLELDNQLSLYVTSRPTQLPALDAYPQEAIPPFGEPDAFGFVGETPASWALREKLAFAGLANQHVLLLGDSGTGKELAAHAVHALSPRASRPMVARNAATVPPGIIDAELFGNVRDYPNAGMRERPGLIGEANGSTLFLDEIGEMPWDLQAHLLRVIDAGGEYQRLGDARTLRAQLRLVVATNRQASELKHDLVARLTLHITIPGLDARREDTPLLLRHLALRAARNAPQLGARFVDGWDGKSGNPRISQKLVARLLSLPCAHHVRDVDQVLWRALSTSTGSIIEDTAEVRGAYPAPSRARAVVSGPEPTPELLREALRSHGGNITRTARALGLSSRFALYRLMRKHGIESCPQSDNDER